MSNYPHPLLIAGLAITLMPASASATAGSCRGANAKLSTASPVLLERATSCLLNAERAVRHLRPLVPNATLRRIALRHSRDMVEHHYFAHRGPDGHSFLVDMT